MAWQNTIGGLLMTVRDCLRNNYNNMRTAYLTLLTGAGILYTLPTAPATSAILIDGAPPLNTSGYPQISVGWIPPIVIVNGAPAALNTVKTTLRISSWFLHAGTGDGKFTAGETVDLVSSDLRTLLIRSLRDPLVGLMVNPLYAAALITDVQEVGGHSLPSKNLIDGTNYRLFEELDVQISHSIIYQ